MRFYTCDVSLEGDRRHVVRKVNMSPAELMIMQAVHGHGAVTNISREPQAKRDNTSHAELRARLERTYGRVRIGSDNDPKPMLPQVFPGWPNVKFPVDAEAAGIDAIFMADEDKPKAKATRRTSRKAEPEPEPAAETETDFTE